MLRCVHNCSQASVLYSFRFNDALASHVDMNYPVLGCIAIYVTRCARDSQVAESAETLYLGALPSTARARGGSEIHDAVAA